MRSFLSTANNELTLVTDTATLPFQFMNQSVVYDTSGFTVSAGDNDSWAFPFPGVSLGDVVTVASDVDLFGMTLTVAVTAADTVQVTVFNGSGIAADVNKFTVFRMAT